MNLPLIPDSALQRLRAYGPPAADGRLPARLPEQHVANILGALHITRQALRLFAEVPAASSRVRIQQLDPLQQHVYLAPLAGEAPPCAAPGGGAANLVGALGHVWVVMPCELLDAGHLGDTDCFCTAFPSEVLYLEVRRKSRVSADFALSVLFPGEAAPRDCTVMDLSDSGLALDIPGAWALPLQPTLRIEQAYLKMPDGPPAALDLEIVHVSHAAERTRAGARFRLAGRAERSRLRRLLARPQGRRGGADAQFADVLSRSMR